MNLVPVDHQIGRLRFVKQLDNFRGAAVLVQDVATKKYHAISAVMLPSMYGLGGPEIMIFPSDEKGEVTDWGEEACWREMMSLSDVMREFSLILEDETDA